MGLLKGSLLCPVDYIAKLKTSMVAYTTASSDITALIVLSLIYLVFSWYFDKVLPWNEGYRYPFYFPFQPSFWGCVPAVQASASMLF